MKQQTVAQPIKRRASLAQPPQPTYVTNLPTRSLDTEPLRTRGRTHFLVYFGIGMLLVLVLYVLWNALVIPWWQGIEDQWQAGTGRITRFEANVGHGGVSTFFAFVLDNQVIIVEVPGGDMGKANYYRTGELTGTTGNPIVTLSLEDANNDGKPDLIIHVEGVSPAIVLYNNGTGFQPTSP